MDYIIVPIIWIVLIVLLIAFIASNIVIVPQAKAYVIERLGTYRDTWSTGLHFKVPLFERIARKVTLKEQVVDFPPQPVITKDNVTMEIETRSCTSRLPTRSCLHTVSKARWRQSKI